jgi:CHAT domain-containing protein
VTALATALRDKTANPIPAARALYGPIFGPIESELKALGAETLLWSLDGALRYVPVAALHDGSRYVVESYACASVSRASVARLADRPSRPWRGVGLGVSQKIGEFAPLPSVADELDGIFGAAADGDPVRGEVLLDARFTEQAFESAVRGAPPVLHVATHFQLVPGKADDSLLLLGDGGLLTVGDIRRMKDAFKGVELLALSACETAVPSDQDGREVECFATIAQNRGARAVLASLWPVNDRSTSALMQAFYRAREAQTGPTKAQALREAQLKLLSGEIKGSGAAPDRALVHGDAKGAGTFVKDPNAPFAHPYYWASFIMLGNPR